ncbi:hypothetical protein M9H77_18395 [Catharanthus roseus]|uniref:Uncharacterized protein n=1 Tax=Catharanthus roseus TaxID=4058 RepID=A0ACC0B7I2_CATRO|nr:hypothetical protein M9H77_18395 [Catharanthus roseus]
MSQLFALMSKRGGRCKAYSLIVPFCFRNIKAKTSTYALSYKRLSLLSSESCLFAYVLLGLWKSRNSILFQKTSTSPIENSKGKQVQGDALGNTNPREFNNCIFIQDTSLANTEIDWCPPVEVQVKFNVDTAWKNEVGG